MAKKRKNVERQTESKKPAERPLEALETSEAEASKRPGSLLRTCVLFVVYMAVSQVLLNLYYRFYRFPLRDLTARIVSSLLNGIGVVNTTENYTVYLRNDTWVITSECTAIHAVCLFVAFVLAYAATFRAKLTAVILGIPIIVAVNIVRLVVLGWVTEHWPRYAHIIHDYVWESLFLFLIVALWLIWVDLVVNREKAPAVSR